MTWIEIYLLTFFSLNYFALLLIKKVFKKGDSHIKLIVASLMFSALKIILDLYVNFQLQIIILIVFTIVEIAVIYKPNNYKIMIKYSILATIYILFCYCESVFLQILCNKTINLLSNICNFCILSFCLINFALLTVLYEKFIKNNNIKLLKQCKMSLDSKVAIFSGFVDTGNRLVDKKSGSEIVIVNFSAIKIIFENIGQSINIFLSSPKCRKIEYNTISGKGYLYIFKPQKFIVEDNIFDCYVGIDFSNSFSEFDCLLSGSCL